MSTSEQGRTVAEIAMTLTDKPTPTAVEVLAALNRAYQAGFAQGTLSGSQHMASVTSMLLSPKPLEGFDNE